jgi:hypothetical protein
MTVGGDKVKAAGLIDRNPGTPVRDGGANSGPAYLIAVAPAAP